jgi:PIN domain nuclease of toxin-antitoxin system
MPFLLDTHTFIWFINGDTALPLNTIATIKNIENKCFISIASIWEIAIKASLNKLELKAGFDNIHNFLAENAIEILPLTFAHIQSLNTLDFHHRDPFDRIIIAQSITEQLTIITKDEHFTKYSCEVLW